MVPDVIWEPLERLSDRDFRRVMLAMRAMGEPGIFLKSAAAARSK